MSIQILSADVVDQIAAGEVVERPAHLVKELVENSLDANSTQVQIEIADGGRYVKITDNGDGITKEDLPKALARFATSKISKTQDLWALASFGFRGEALASISSVSHLTLQSRKKDAETGYRLIAEFSKLGPVDPVGGPQGTTIIVDRLFDNVPARLKFLKSDAAESAAIKNAVKALALAHPGVEFRLQEQGRLIFYWPACASKKARVEQILEVSPMYEGTAQREYVKAHVIFADPHHVAKTSKNIWMFAQNRWVQDRSLQAAVMEAYRNLLMHGEFPIAAVWVETDPEMIDVNIHPTKSQVKFQNPSLAFRAVAGALREALERAPWIQMPLSKPAEGLAMGGLVAPEAPAENLRFSDQQLDRAQYAKKDFPLPNYADLAIAAQSRQNLMVGLAAGEMASVGSSMAEPGSGRDFNFSMPARKENGLETSAPLGYWGRLEVLGQAHQTYIICQSADKMVFVDQHAAHERVAFEKLMSSWKGGKIDVQEFLFPLAVDLSPEKVEALLLQSADFERLGVSIEALGPSTVGVKAAPLLLKESVFARVLDQVATEVLEQGGSYSFEKVVGDLCATMACHSVVRAGQTLSLEQMRSLLHEMDQFPLSSFCPHGRPVSVEYPFVKLEKEFGRIV